MPVQAVLFSEMIPAPEWEDSFNEWYDTEHIPVRMGAKKFLGAQRYRATEGPEYLAVYDLESVEALSTPAYRRIKENPSEVTACMLRSVTGFTRYTGRLISWQTQDHRDDAEILSSPYLFSVLFAVPVEREEEFNNWYEQEHVPLLLKAEEWLGCRRYRISDGVPSNYTHLAIHHLSSLLALESPARSAARATPWRQRLAQEPWFKGHYKVWQSIGSRFQASA